MGRHLAFVVACLFFAGSALADELPTRKAGLWKITMQFAGGRMPAQSIQQCTDAATDKAMFGSFNKAGEENCSEHHITHQGATIVVDTVCHIGPAKMTSHAEISGDFNSAYTIKVTSEGGPQMTRMAPSGESHMTMQAKYLGACGKDQRPGDIIMPGGFKMNVKEMRMMHGGMRPQR